MVKQRITSYTNDHLSYQNSRKLVAQLNDVESARKNRMTYFKNRYQLEITKKQILSKYDLNSTYEKINKNLDRNLRYLKWRRNCTPTSNKADKTIGFDHEVYLKNLTDKRENYLNSKDFNTNLPNSSFKHQFSKYLPREYEGKGVNQEFYKQLFDMSYQDKIDAIRKEFKDLRFKVKNRVASVVLNKPLKIKRDENKTKKIQIEEKCTALDKNVNIKQKLLRGRAYHAMMYTAKLKLGENLRTILNPEKAENRLFDSENDKKQTIANDVLEFSARKHISRFMDTLYKETVRIHEEIENKILIQKAEKARIMAEAAESNRRQIVEKGRMEQNEKFKQVMKIHQEIAELSFEEFIEQAMERSAEEESKRFMKTVTSRSKFNEQKFYDKSRRELEADLVLNFIIPECDKVIQRKNIKHNQAKYLKDIRDMIFTKNTTPDDDEDDEP